MKPARGRRRAPARPAPETERVATVERLGRRGEGRVPAEGALAAAHVPFALPGERVRIAQVRDRGRLLEVLSASPDRVAAPCRHFGACGGCALQHLAAPAYRAFKEDLFRTALAAAGLDPGAFPVDWRAVPPASRRRVTFTVRRERGGRTVLGFAEARSHRLVPVEGCLVLSPALAAALPALGALAAAVVPAGGEGRLVATAVEGGLDVAFAGVGAAPDPLAVADAAAAFADPPLLRATAGGEILYQAAEPVVRVADVAVPFPPGAFLQASAEAERAVADAVVAATDGARRVADLFCGLGTFALPLARRAAVHAVDGDGALVAALAAAARRAAGLRPVATGVRDLMAFPLSARELSAFEAVVFDPPRAGAPALAGEIAAASVPLAIAVSCNPATLARDAARLVAGGFKIAHATLVDQFVYTAHLEVVMVLRRDA